MADLYDHPDLYDALHPAGGHLSCYLDLARRQGGAVLELACGTGCLVTPIAGLGLPTVGLDLSRPMLRAARARAAAADAPVALVQADMRQFALNRTFSLVFVARNSLLHLLSTMDLVAALTAAASHLAPNGILAFDVFNPDVARLARTPGQRYPSMQLVTDAFGPLRVEETSDYESTTQVNRAAWYISTPEQADAWVVPLVLRSIFPQELPLLLSAAGLNLIDRFGELAGAPFHSGSRIQLCVCRRRS